MKIGILIPSTSNGRDWKTYKETYLYSITLKSFLLTYDNEHTYIFYIGIDRNDKILDKNIFRDEVNRLVSIFKNVTVQYLYMDDIKKGHLTVMWNKLYKKALESQCDYFYQCGDDIEFKTKGWINDCIKKLQENDNIGLTGPINNNPYILTQSFVSRKHYDLFGYYFPEEIINWFCDDWINDVYKGLNAFYPLKQHLCINIGGLPRYDIDHNPHFKMNFYFNKKIASEKCMEIVKRDLIRISSKYKKL
jgi:hypothetical protein